MASIKRLFEKVQRDRAGTPPDAWDTKWNRARQALERWHSTATLHLDESEARVLVVRQGRPVNWGSARIPMGLYSDGVVHDPEGLSTLLESLLLRHRVSRKGLRITVGGFHTVIRTIVVPKLKPRFMPEAIRRQMRREVPVTLENHHLTWRVLGPTNETADEVRVLVIAIPRNELESVLRALRLARIRPASVQWKPLAVLRALNTPSAAVVVLESTGFDIILSRDGLPLVVRSIAYPPTVRSLSQRVQVASTELGLAVSYAMLEEADEGNGDPAPVLLLGEAAETESVRERFEEASGYSLVDPEFLAEDAPLRAYAANLGAAATRSSTIGAPFLDLLPERWRPTTVNVLEGAAAAVLAVGLGVIALPLFHSLQPDPRIHSLQQAVDQTKIAVRIDNAHAADRAQLAKEVSGVQSELAAYRQGFVALQGKKLRWPEVVAATPPDLASVAIDSVSEDGSALQLSGHAPSYAQITAYAKFLTATGWFDSVQLTSMLPASNDTQSTSLDFRLSANPVLSGGTRNAQNG